MCPICEEQSHNGCRQAKLVAAGENSYSSCPLNFHKSISQSSTFSIMSDGSKPNIVYQRKKLSKNFTVSILAQSKPDVKKSGDCVSVLSCVGPIVVPKENNEVIQIRREGESIGSKVVPLLVYDRNPSRIKTIKMCSQAGGHGSSEAPKDSKQKNIEVDSVNDSCSSSKSNLEACFPSTKSDIAEAGECTSSSVTILEDTGEDLSGKDLCLFILRSQGLLGVLSRNSQDSAKDIETSSGNSCSRSCKTCGRSESVLNMIICDHCEEAFHVSCCNPRMKKVPIDEWFCHSCLKKKHKILKETVDIKSAIIKNEARKFSNGFSKGEANPIVLALKDTGPYTTGVRIGKGFQAEVPTWSGQHPKNNAIDTVGERVELNLSESPHIDDQASKKLFKSGSMSNWLQCQEVVDLGEGVNGTICGKWRRAPINEVQTDEWECFCCVLWDPVHADCSVPQELETHEVLKQLKYIEMLRPRIASKRRKLNQTKGSGKIQHISLDMTTR